MAILVTYASKHGATRGIAERIADSLRAAGLQAEVCSVRDAVGLERYDAFVVGSAVYAFHWRKGAVAFVRRNRELLASRPVWLFSSGPLGTKATDAKGRDLREMTVPREITELKAIIAPRDHQVFFGALSPMALSLAERLLRKLPAARAMLPEGDFRDWAEIEDWSANIARDLAHAVPGG